MRRIAFGLAIVFVSVPLLAQAGSTFAFRLRIDGMTGDLGAGTAFFKSCTGLESTTEVVEYREGGESGTIRKIPGTLRYGNITLKRGITADNSLALWRGLLEDGHFDQARRSGTIVLVDKANREIARWNLVNAWPARLSIEADETSGDPQEIMVIAVDASRRP